MKKCLFWILMTATGLAIGASHQAPLESKIIRELSRRSHLSEVDLKQRLGECDASQLNTNFCADRDRIAAEIALKHVISDWEKRRDSACKKSAEREFGHGSMKLTAFSICVTAETNRLIQRLEAGK